MKAKDQLRQDTGTKGMWSSLGHSPTWPGEEWAVSKQMRRRPDASHGGNCEILSALPGSDGAVPETPSILTAFLSCFNYQQLELLNPSTVDHSAAGLRTQPAPGTPAHNTSFPLAVPLCLRICFSEGWGDSIGQLISQG